MGCSASKTGAENVHNKPVSSEAVELLEAAFARLQESEECHSLLKKYLTREVFDMIKTRRTAMGATLMDVIQSGVSNLDSGCGVYAPDAESYNTFAPLFDKIIEDYHQGFKPSDKQPAKNFGDMNDFVDLDPSGKYVISTRVRCGRSVQEFPLNPMMTEDMYKQLEEKVKGELAKLDGELEGSYYPLMGMSSETQNQLIADHFLFKEGDRFLQAAHACEHWPVGRGIFHNKDKTFLMWVNEEDHLRIISMQSGGDLKQVFSRLVKGVNSIEQSVHFSHDKRLGFITFCPTNLGTTIRASVHIRLPNLGADRATLEEVARRYSLQVRGTAGEHSDSQEGVYDISNKRRLGLTEHEAVLEMQKGILELIQLEESLAAPAAEEN